MRAQRKAGQPRHGLIDGERAVIAGQCENARARRAVHGLDDPFNASISSAACGCGSAAGSKTNTV